MNSNLVKLLVNNWQPIVIIALVGTGLAVSHHQGYKSAFAKQQAVIDKMEKTKRKPLLLSAQNYARELEKRARKLNNLKPRRTPSV